MTSNRPYLIRALYEWILDNQMTPYLLVNAEVGGVQVPSQHVKDGRIILNLKPAAIDALQLGNDAIEFNARFGGIPFSIRIPPAAVLAIYAPENGQGMAFGEDLHVEGSDGGGGDDDPPPAGSESGKKPALRVVK
ncbi:MAG: ClpXP protease specificity-enhancing factor [Candidatus Competibacterales bacterium]